MATIKNNNKNILYSTVHFLFITRLSFAFPSEWSPNQGSVGTVVQVALPRWIVGVR